VRGGQVLATLAGQHGDGVTGVCLGHTGETVLSVGADGAGTLCVWEWQTGRVRGGAVGVCGGRWERIVGVAACGADGGDDAAEETDRLACWAVTFGAGHVSFWSVWAGDDGGDAEGRGADYVDDSDGPRWRVEGGPGRLGGAGVAQTMLCGVFVAVRWMRRADCRRTFTRDLTRASHGSVTCESQVGHGGHGVTAAVQKWSQDAAAAAATAVSIRYAI
jgi:hypothetical protein